MAQESWKKETDETEFHTAETPVLCINNCGFFGSPGTNNLCSKCHRDFTMKKQTQTLIEKAPNLLSSSSSSTSPTLLEPISKNLKNSSISEKKLEVEVEIEPKGPKQPISVSNRCLLCKKKVGLTGFKCRCGGTYCSTHRYSETHKCSFDYKSAGRDAIAKENPVVMAEKINKI